MDAKTDAQALEDLLELYADYIQLESLHSLYQATVKQQFEEAKREVLSRMKGTKR